MPIYEREQRYLQLLAEREYTIKELAQRLFISEPTVRRDVAALTKKGLVTTNRGVVKRKIISPDSRFPLFLREAEQADEKEALAQQAVSLIQEGNTVMLDASSTVSHIVPHLSRFKKILVITYGLKNALALALMEIPCICIGGGVATESCSCMGSDAETQLRQYNADIAFFSCRGLTQDGVASDTSILDNSMRRIMMKNARRSYLLCDKKKVGRTCLNTLCHIDELDGVITDTHGSDDQN